MTMLSQIMWNASMPRRGAENQSEMRFDMAVCAAECAIIDIDIRRGGFSREILTPIAGSGERGGIPPKGASGLLLTIFPPQCL